MALLLKNAHVVDPSVELDGRVDVLVEDDKIAAVGENLSHEGAEVVDLSGKYLVPGLVDMHVHLREPGFDLGLQILRRILGRALAFAFRQRHEATRAGGVNLCGDTRVLGLRVQIVFAHFRTLLQHAPLCVVCGSGVCGCGWRG